MITHYIIYYEGVGDSGSVVMNGNMGIDVENLEGSGPFLDYLNDFGLKEAQKIYSGVSRIVVKGVFKL